MLTDGELNNCSPSKQDVSDRKATMSNKTEGIVSTMAAILVLFTTMLDPRISVGLAVAFLIGLGIYHLARKN